MRSTTYCCVSKAELAVAYSAHTKTFELGLTTICMSDGQLSASDTITTLRITDTSSKSTAPTSSSLVASTLCCMHR